MVPPLVRRVLVNVTMLYSVEGGYTGASGSLFFELQKIIGGYNLLSRLSPNCYRNMDYDELLKTAGSLLVFLLLLFKSPTELLPYHL